MPMPSMAARSTDEKIAAADDGPVSDLGSLPPVACTSARHHWVLLVHRQPSDLRKLSVVISPRRARSVGTGGEALAHFAEFADDQLAVGVELGRGAQGHVDPFLDEIDPPVEGGDQQADTRISAVKGGQDVGEHRV